MVSTDGVFRPLPRLEGLAGEFWRSGADGTLRVLRCGTCRTWVHPPQPVCPGCLGRAVAFEPTSGRGRVYSFTVNEHPWNPTVPLPYVIAVVELDEQPGLRITSNVVGCDADEVVIGMPVCVRFVEDDGVYLPMFEPEARTPANPSLLDKMPAVHDDRLRPAVGRRTDGGT